MSKERCECGGRMHVLRSGAWVRCECYAERTASRQMGEAGVSLSLSGKTAKQLRDVCRFPVDLDLPTSSPMLIFVRAAALDQSAVTAYILKAGVEADEPVASTSISELVEARFDVSTRDLVARKLRANVLVVVMVGVDHAFGPEELARVVADRAGFVGLTAFVGAANPSRNEGRFGEAAAKAFRKIRSVVIQ